MVPDFGPDPDQAAAPDAPPFRTGEGFAWGESRYTEAVGAEICRRLADGESLAVICRDPAMPAPPTVHKWAGLHPEFAEAKARAQRKAWRRERRVQAGKLKKRLARLVEAGRAPSGPPSTYSEEMAELICRRLAHGEPLMEICREAHMPSYVTVYAWMRRDPAFAYMVGLARELQAGLKLDLAWTIARDATPETVGVARLQIQTLRWHAARLAPRGDPAPPTEVMDRIRREGPDSYTARHNPELATRSLGEGDWD
ncbi:hypothetical protein [Phenylobacterium sp.]|jgi:hypothetical protein|uniref:terminase small subunit-like protein n=1 Tax=Phenylobacterium sp. TaxID=1871053 RepID=UPI002F428A1A